MQIPNNIPSDVFSISAVIVGYLLANSYTPNEQNAVGNWLMLVSQYLCTNAAYGQLKQSRSQTPGSFSENNQNFNNPSSQDTIEMLTKMVNAINEEIAEIKKNL